MRSFATAVKTLDTIRLACLNSFRQRDREVIFVGLLLQREVAYDGIMLSRVVLAELQDELTRLAKEEEFIRQRIAAIRSILGMDLVDEPDAPQVTAAAIVTPAAVTPKSVKALVKDVLRERPGVKSAVVTRILKLRGFHPGGQTRITHRVYNEIWRMVKTGEAEKTEQGGFRLTEKGENSWSG
jgi:hypothetical protein